MVRRKDNKGKVLEKGENQRTDGSYMYRWTDVTGARRTIYANSLNELREKEFEVLKLEKIKNVVWADTKLTVGELIERYLATKVVKITTRSRYKYITGLIEELNMLDRPIDTIKTTDAKVYMMQLSDMGYAYGTIQSVKSFLSPAFQSAVEDDILVKNPFIFRLGDVVEDDRKERISLSPQQEKQYLDFVKNDGWFCKCYDEILILLHTGMRVSELYGLTFKDIDLKNKRIHVNKQLHLLNGEYIITSPKSKAGTRTLAMTEEVKKAFANQYTKPRPRTEQIVDGYGGFIFINEQGNPKTRKNLQMSMINIYNKMERQGIEFPKVSPHMLRHTFCSRMVDNGIDVKSLQIIMGHSDIGTTLNVYTHKDPEDVAKTMEKVLLAVCGNA